MSTTPTDEAKTADEQPRRKVARQVIAPKRRYFFPEHGVSVSAGSLAESHKLVNRKLKQRKDGDG